MSPVTQCPRGHALEENAVYCTVCWVRVVPEDPALLAARRRRRRRMFGIPLLGAGAIVVGIAVGGALGSEFSSSPASVAALPASDSPGPATTTSPSDQPKAVTAAPLAATVAEPVPASAGSGCVASVRETDVACAITDDRLEFTVCVPGQTTVIRVGTRPNETVVFEDASAEVALGASTACDSDEVAADVAIDPYSPDAIWRVVGRDAGDEKIWKSRVVTRSDAS